MAQLPFQSERTPEPALSAGPRAPGEASLTVSQLSQLVRGALNSSLPQKLRVVGEVSNFSNRAHWFFSLKDEGASIRCVCFASNARRITCPVADGQLVVATGRIDYYDAQGQIQLYVDKIEPVGVGELELRFRALCLELRELGYFAQERKKPLPAFPRCIAVITSRTGAALQDVINTAGKRWRGCRLLILDTVVQGAAAAEQVAAALGRLSEQGGALGVDAILLTRGGGSLEDLWAFNERVVADAIYRCRLPVVAAIGHETDTTVAELVADLRCATPTQAAMQLIPDQASLDQQWEQMGRRLHLLMGRRLQEAQQRVQSAARHRLFRRPQELWLASQQRLDQAQQRLTRCGEQLPRSRREQLEALHRHLQAVGPRNVLNRGYSYTLGPDERVLRDPAAAPPGSRITTVLAQGQLLSQVLGDGPEQATPPSVTQAPTASNHSRRGRGKSVDPQQPGLFGN